MKDNNGVDYGWGGGLLQALLLLAFAIVALILMFALPGCTMRPVQAGFGLGPTGWVNYDGGSASVKSALLGDGDAAAVPPGTLVIQAGEGVKAVGTFEVNDVPGSHQTTHENRTGLLKR